MWTFWFVLSLALATSDAPSTMSAPAPRKAPDPPAAEYRFDALRIDGTVYGPEALVIQSTISKKFAPLHRFKRSFVHRIFETVEAPGLHQGAAR